MEGILRQRLRDQNEDEGEEPYMGRRRSATPDHRHPDMERVRVVQDVAVKLTRLRGALGQWVWKSTGGGRHGGGYGMLFTPVWPGRYAHLIYGQAEKVLVMSATLTPKTADLLEIKEDERVWLEAESSYPPRNTPVRHIRTVRMDHRVSEMDLKTWVNRIDQIIDRRLDRKGLILPVSYQRGEYIASHSRHSKSIITHDQGRVLQAVERWRRAAPPSVLVSPSTVRGWDFPGDTCRYIIIAKLPFPDGRDPVIKARNDSDPDFAGFETMQAVVQEAGRGTRSADDWCEVMVVDDHFSWFFRKNQQHAPQFFRDRVLRSTDVIPDPPPLTGPPQTVASG